MIDWIEKTFGIAVYDDGETVSAWYGGQFLSADSPWLLLSALRSLSGQRFLALAA